MLENIHVMYMIVRVCARARSDQERGSEGAVFIVMIRQAYCAHNCAQEESKHLVHTRRLMPQSVTLGLVEGPHCVFR